MVKKVIKLFVLFISCAISFSCSNYSYNGVIKEDYIKIEKINLNKEYYIMSLKDNIKNIAMFDECGRPDIVGTNTVIGAHSGSLDYAYFNDLHLLSEGDFVLLSYNGKKYTYVVKKIIEVDDTDVDVLNDTGESILTLLTCKIGDSMKRIVVICELKR